ncbi:MAG TPA: phosphotransferase [Steroidobacteraceae bacterium]|nr:phosphotransferase [Steroidobacteraceae bacterium]
MDLDLALLESYLRQHVAGFSGTLTGTRLSGGQSNPTYRLSAGGRDYVLRRKPFGQLLPSAHAIEREYRVMTALASTDVPVPRTYCLCADATVIGSAFFVMEFMAGRVFADPALPGCSAQERTAMYSELNRVIAALHQVDFAAVGLANYGKHERFLERQIDRWSRQYRASATESIDAMDRLMEWLPRHLPPGEETTVVHGDLRVDNVVFHPTQPRLIAVLDWELSTLGHPLADFAYHLMSWRLTPGEFRGLMGQDLRALGIPSEAETLAAYCRRTGREAIEHYDFYLVYNMFRLAAILQGIKARALAGNASSADALETGNRARVIAERSWHYVQQIRSNR